MELGPDGMRGRRRGPQLGLPLGREGLLAGPLLRQLRRPAPLQRARDSSRVRVPGRTQGPHKGISSQLSHFFSYYLVVIMHECM